MSLRTLFHSLLVLAFGLAPSASTLAADSQPRAVLWSLKGKTNTVYLLGSVHFLRPSEQLPATVDAAYRDAEQLLMEIDMDDLDPMQTQQLTLELGMLPEGQTLESQLGAATYAKVSDYARSLGIDPILLNRFKPWLAALTLVQVQLMKLGLDPNAGIEQRFVTRAAQDKKEIRGLETLREQLAMMADLPAAQQREFLLYSVEDTERATREIDDLIAAWRVGDIARLSKLMAEGFDQYPDLYRPLTIDRNRRWVTPIEDLLDDRDDYLVIVGALHLVGPDSVIDLLEKRGHKVTRH
jgi:uncharacterized protein YbaP (TraB family)